MSSSPFGFSALQLISAIPFLLVAFAGAVVCMIRESRPVRVRIAVGCALAIQLGLRMLMPLVYSQLSRVLSPAISSPNETPFIIINLLSSVVWAATLAVLLWAAFTNDDRPPAETA
ncbi:MAG: hypothetical protein U0992_00325 [Planctomycetaceae bacterium]